LNAYIYAIAEEGADVDNEIFNLERIKRKEGFDVFTSGLTFEHNPAIFH